MDAMKLYKYQNLQMTYQQIKKEAENASEKQILKKWKVKIEKLNQELENKKTMQKEKTKTSKQIAATSKETQRKVEEMEKELYLGKVTNPKELLSMQQKLEELNEHQKSTQEKAQELSIELEELKEVIRGIKNEIEKEYRQYQKRTKVYVQNREINKTKLHEMSEKIKAMEADIDPAELALYKKIVGRTGNTAVARVKNEQCEGCNMEIHKVAFSALKNVGNELVICENCGRILFINHR